MTLRPLTHGLVAAALALATLGGGCLDGPVVRQQGDRGYACYEHTECLSPLLCLSVPAVDYPVCTGSALEGATCDATEPCAWIRDDRGLPLACVDATCNFPPDEVAQ